MLQFDLGTTTCLQQKLSGTGVFNGSHMGRATVDLGSSGSLVRFRARRYGADGNNLRVALVDAGAGTAVSVTNVQLVGNNLVNVNLRRTTGAIVATADEVANAVNNYLNTNNPSQQLPVVAYAPGTSVVVAAAATNLAGGLDPTIMAPQVKFEAANVNGGLIYFDQDVPIVVRQLECYFSDPGGSESVSFKVANLTTGLEVDASEAITIFTATVTTSQRYASFAAANFIMLPHQCLQIITSGPTLSGVARVYARRESQFASAEGLGP